jgi:hypothetical protein
MKYDLYNPEPQGLERRQEVTKLLTSKEPNGVVLKRAIQLYIANACDIDKLEHREYDEDNRAKKSEVAIDGMKADNAKLWELISAKHKDVLSNSMYPSGEFYDIMEDIANIQTLVANTIKHKRAPTKRKSVEVSQEVMDMKVSDLLASTKHKESLSKLITLVETGSAADLVAYAKEVKKEVMS